MKTGERPMLPVVVMLAAAFGGCARLMVVEPETVPQRNSNRWTVGPGRARESPAAEAPAAEAPAVAEPVAPIQQAAPAPAPPPPPIRLTVSPAALQSPPDGYGIPRQLYAEDPILEQYAAIRRARASSRRAAAGGSIAIGCLAAGLAGVLIWRGEVNARAADEARRNGQTVTNDPSTTQFTFGALDGALALGFFVYGVAAMFADPSADGMQRYYRETYGAR